MWVGAPWAGQTEPSQKSSLKEGFLTNTKVETREQAILQNPRTETKTGKQELEA